MDDVSKLETFQPPTEEEIFDLIHRLQEKQIDGSTVATKLFMAFLCLREERDALMTVVQAYQVTERKFSDVLRSLSGVADSMQTLKHQIERRNIQRNGQR